MKHSVYCIVLTIFVLSCGGNKTAQVQDTPKKTEDRPVKKTVVKKVEKKTAIKVPDDKRTILIDFIKHKKKAVPFAHAKHSEEFKDWNGKAIVCKDCHHKLKTPEAPAAEIKGCRQCHVAQGKKQIVVDGKKAPFIAVKARGKFKMKSVIFHTRCRDCHKKVQAGGNKINKCNSCHHS